MNIRVRLTFLFSAIAGAILLLFSATIYFQSSDYRREEFFSRLEGRALTAARLLVSVDQVDQNLLRIIDQNSVYALVEEKVWIYNPRDELVYSSPKDSKIAHSSEMLAQIRQEGKVTHSENDVESVGVLYDSNGEKFVVIATAFDRYGRSKLINLRSTLGLGLVFGLLAIALSGVFFAGQALQPLVKMNREISTITAGNLDSRVDEGNRHDEIAQLAINFNEMLARLEASFEAQHQFVSGASHELRTPLAAMTGQLQLILDRERSPEQYRQVLQSLRDDTQGLVKLTNGLLTLAQAETTAQPIHFQQVRIDEVLFAAQNELAKNNPDYHFSIEYDSLPDDESALTLAGNEHLLKTAFLNLMDNACKFSPDGSVRVGLNPSGAEGLEINFTDGGAGIAPEERERIFLPFYRSQNVQGRTRGHGIGLALCRSIVRMHGGSIRLVSEVGRGSTFSVVFRK